MKRTRRFVSLVFLSGSLFSFPGTGLALDPAKIHVGGGASPFTLIFRLAEDKGYYKEEGLRLEAIAATMQAGIQGLVGGSFDFSQIMGQTSAAVMRGGAPLKIVMVFDTRPLWWLMGSKRVKTVRDLKGGKLVAISGFGSAHDQMTRAVLLRDGVDPEKDVTLQVIGTAMGRLAALLNGTVDAVAVQPVERLMALKNGFNELVFIGDFVETLNAGVAVSENSLRQRPDFVRGFLRGTLKAFHRYKSEEKESVSRIATSLKTSEKEASEIYKGVLRVLTADGAMPRDLQERVIAFQKKALKVEKEITPEIIYDFSLVHSLNKDLARSGW